MGDGAPSRLALTTRTQLLLLGAAPAGLVATVVAAYLLAGGTRPQAAALALATLVLALGLAWHLAHRMAARLVALRQRAEALAGRESHPHAADDIAATAAALDALADTLARNAATLDRRVREATADLEAQRDRAERAVQAKSRFFAAASHDLRQPLHALSLFVGALKARTHQPESQTLIDNIEASTAAMGLLFNALLDISRLDAGAVEPRRQHFALGQLLDQLARQFAPLAAEKHLRLRFRPCTATVYSDPLLVERILANLVANAVRYTDDGGVLVACRRRGERLRISVYDTGRGIPAAQQEQVFQEFVQLQNAERDRSKGLGLGLAIVARLARLLDHPLELHSRPGRGTVFTVDLPFGDTAEIQPPAPPTAPPTQLPADALVLLIDDEQAILRGMNELFDHWNIALVTARSADEAEHWLDALERVPDVIVSDFRLVDDDGIAVIQRMREKFGRAIPAILITGDTAPDTIRRIGDSGIPLLHKPLRPAKLRALLTHLIQQAPRSPVG